MKTLNEMIELIRSENPDGLRVGDDEQGYTMISAEEYEATITDWANARLAKQAKAVETDAIIEAKKQAISKLIELGIDPKAFNLEAEQSTPNLTNEPAAKS